ncbi:hypothetical protein [Sphingobacterium detergens]
MSDYLKPVFETVSKTFEDLINPVKARMSNHISASFILSVLAFNWRTILYLFLSKTTIAESFAYLDKNIYKEGEAWNLFLVYPLLVSFVYCFILPGLTEVYERMVQFFKKNNQIRNFEIVEKDLQDQVTYAGLLAQRERASKDLEELTDLSEEIQNLRELVEQKDKDIRDLNTKLLEEGEKANQENTKYTAAINEKNELSTEVDRLKIGLKSIVTNIVSNEKPGTFSGRKLIGDIHQLPITDNSLKYELSNIVEQETKVPYKIQVKLKDGFSHTSITDTFSPTHPMETIEVNGDYMTFIIKFDFETDIQVFIKQLRDWNIMEEVNLLESGE